MKAWLLDGYNGVGSLRLGEVAAPVPAPGEVLLELRYAALNPADRYLTEQQYPARPTFPHILGREGLGTVVAVGEGVTRWKVGDELAVLPGPVGADRWGTLADRVAVPADQVVAPPAHWEPEQRAASVLVYLTAWEALTQWGKLPPSVVLVTGASGGVGSATVQLASAMHHHVIALTRNDAKADALRQLGASMVVNCTTPEWPRTLRKELGTQRVDLAIDNIGGELLPQVIETMGLNGRVSLVGRLAGPVPQFNTATLFFRRLRMGGVAVPLSTPAELQANYREVVHLLDNSQRRPAVDRVFPFTRLPDAFARLEQGPIGKVLVQIR